ncbi:MAG: M56 family metallopeptidase [Rubripirellula sp.]
MNETIFFQVSQQISWTLVHSLWQFALIAVVLGIGLRLTRGRSPRGRYAFKLAAMLLMLVTSVITFFTVRPQVELAESPLASVLVSTNIELEKAVAAGDLSLSLTTSPMSTSIARDRQARDLNHKVIGSSENERSVHDFFARCVSVLRSFVGVWMHAIVACWLSGTLFLSLRPLIGWRAIRKLRSQGRTHVSDSIQMATKRVANRLGVQRVVEIAESSLVEVPTMIGWLKPIILLPASAVIGLSTQQLEAVIAHELAHVRRHDYVVNLFQLAMETVFFYHPAVWWVSHRMRLEREECCDEIAAGLTGDRVGYAKLLVWLEQARQQPPKQTFAMSAIGGSLLGRVRRLASPPSPSTGVGPLVTAMVVALIVGAICMATLNLSHSWGQDPDPAQPSDTAQIRSWMTRVIDLEQWSRLPGLATQLAENGEYEEAIHWLSKVPLGPSKEGKFSPGSYSMTIGEICKVALKNDKLPIALEAFEQLTDPAGTPRSAEWDRISSMSYHRAVRETRSAILNHHVSKGQFDAALTYLDTQPTGTHGTLVAGVAAKLPSLGHGDHVETFWQRLTDPKLRDTCRFRLANAYYHLHQPDKIWRLADQMTKFNPDDLQAEVRTRSTAMKCYGRVSPQRFDELLPKMRIKISQLPAADQSRYWEQMALAAARLQRYELMVELSAKVPLLIEARFSAMDLSGRDRHPVLFAITELLKQRQFDQAFSLIDLVDDEAVQLAALARVPMTIVTSNETKQYSRVYEQGVIRLAAAYRVFAEKHDDETVRRTVPALPESLSVHLRRLENPPMPPDKVAHLNRQRLALSGPNTKLLIEQGKIDEVVELAEDLLSTGDEGFAKWMARELAKSGHADAFETLRLKINEAQSKSGAKKPGKPMSPWDHRQFLALSAHSAYVSGQRDLCFAIFLQLDQNWMSPSHVSRVAAAARTSGDIAFLRRMESSKSPLMREAALAALAMHHVLEGDIEAAAGAAETFDREFGNGNEKWSIYRRITHEKSVKDPNRRIAATKLALQKIPVDSKDYPFIARDHAKLLGELFPTTALPADWLENLQSNPELLLQVELNHASRRGKVSGGE